MNLRRQLLLVSLLTLVLPWAGCQFIRETESALRKGQQQMLSGTAQAVADSLSLYSQDFVAQRDPNRLIENQLYGHPLTAEPLIDGYFDDWALPMQSMRTLRGTDGSIRVITAVSRQYLFLFVDVNDSSVIYQVSQSDDPFRRFSDRVAVATVDSRGTILNYEFRPEAPGTIIPMRVTDAGSLPEQRIQAYWQDTPSGYRLEARFPRLPLLERMERIGVTVTNTASAENPGIRSSTYAGDLPGRFVTISPALQSVADLYAQPGTRLIITDQAGWRLAIAGDVAGVRLQNRDAIDVSPWLRLAYAALLQPGGEAALATPDPSGREQQSYVSQALAARASTSWFRSADTGRAVVAVAQPVWSGSVQTGALVLQQDTDAILSLTNQAFARLITFTLIATVVAAAALLGYASWLSLRIRRLSFAAELALDDRELRAHLPSADSGDEIGDLSRSFSNVLQQLGQYNEYLRTLAAKLSHELRTPMTIVSSSLENLEHEQLSDASAEYTARARDGVERLRKILNAMSEAHRVEELMQNIDADRFPLGKVLESAVAAYADAWPERRFTYECSALDSDVLGSPELVIQMLDKLVDNAVDFTAEGDEISVSLGTGDAGLVMQVRNPGPPLPETMRARLFDSMVSMRNESHGKHLGLGLHIVRLIAEGHDGSVSAENVEGGVEFRVELPSASSSS